MHKQKAKFLDLFKSLFASFCKNTWKMQGYAIIFYYNI